MSVYSIILPAHNEAQALPIVLEQLFVFLPDAEIIVVDDGSTDGTGSIAAGLGATVIRHPLRLGAGRSVKDGIDAASCDIIVMLDADGTYPAERIPDFLAKLDEGYDLVVGARRGKEYRGSVFKLGARFVFRCIAEFATGKRIPDINSGMRAFRKSRIRPLFPHICNGFSLPTTMTLAYFFTGGQVHYLPIAYHRRIGKSKVRIVRDSMRTLQYIVESVAYFNPLKLFLLLSLLCLAIGTLSAWFLRSLPVLSLSVFIAILIFSLGLHAHGAARRR